MAVPMCRSQGGRRQEGHLLTVLRQRTATSEVCRVETPSGPQSRVDSARSWETSIYPTRSTRNIGANCRVKTLGSSALGRNNRDGGYLGKYENWVFLLQFFIHVWLISTHIVLLSWDSFNVARFKPKNKTKTQWQVGTRVKGLECVDTSEPHRVSHL